MGEIYKVGNPIEALKLAKHFQEEKKYDLFRGQNQDWPLVTSLGRLADKNIEANRNRILKLYEFLYQYESTRRYAENTNDLLAIAQHYGIPSDFIDFTRSVEIALFFATYSKHKLIGKEGVIYCLDTRDFYDHINFWKVWLEQKEIAPPYVYETKIESLWRLTAQKGCFVQSNFLDFNRFYSMDKIIFPHTEHIDIIDVNDVYPINKSDLEILLDNYFARERMNEGALRFQNFSENFGIPIKRIPSEPHYKYVKSKKWHLSWSAKNTKKWIYKASEPLRKKADIQFELNVKSVGDFHKDVSEIKKQLIRLFKDNKITRRDYISPTITFKPAIRSKRLSSLIEKSVKNIWDGMRTLPYTKQQIVCAISKYLTLELYCSAKHVDIETCIFSPILIEMSDCFRAHLRCYVSKFVLEEAIRKDILDIQDDSFPRFISSEILFFIQKVRIVFDFNILTRLFASEIIPSMMVRNKYSDRPMLIFSAVYVDRLGYA